MADDRLDVLILGASGFTGLHCIPYIHKLSKADGRNLTWGVAGRSEEKLKAVLETEGKKLEADLSKIPVIVTDINDDDSLLKMAKRAKVVINCCGPFRFLGEPVVRACIAAGTHHIDVSGEPQYIEKVQLEQDQDAKEKGVYVVSACGLDCIPNDLGVVFLQQKFDGVLNSVETYMELGGEEKRSGPVLNYGTWESLIYSLVHASELRDLRKKLFTQKLPTFTPKLARKQLPHKSNVVDGWVLPFLGADRSVMTRTQRHFYEKESKRPIQVNTYFMLQSFLQVIFFLIFSSILLLLTRFKWSTKLLLNYPAFFTAGFVSKKQPSEETIEKSRFQITLYGEGWKERLDDELENYAVPPNKAIVGRVKGKNPGYGSTCICLVVAAITLLEERDKIPGEGGVLTPGAAFAKTSLIKLLHENGVTFDVISEKDI